MSFKNDVLEVLESGEKVTTLGGDPGQVAKVIYQLRNEGHVIYSNRSSDSMGPYTSYRLSQNPRPTSRYARHTAAGRHKAARRSLYAAVRLNPE